MKLVVSVSVLYLAAAAATKIPDFIPTCSRNDPNIEDCIVRAVDTLRPKLMKGIPELDVPSILPFRLDELVMSPAGSGYRIVGRDISARGVENFRVHRLKADLEHNTFYVGVEIPNILFDGRYALNIPAPIMSVTGNGEVHGNVTGIRANAVLEGKVAKRDGKSYYNFKTLDLDIKITDYKIILTGLFGNNKMLQDVALSMINERSKEFAWMAEPFAERAASTLLLQYAQKITSHLPIEEIFPDV